MNTRKTAERWPQAVGATLLVSGAIVAGAYFYFTQSNGKGTAAPARPNPDFTTSPEGGVKVDLPTIPATTRPDAAPSADGTAPTDPDPERASPTNP